MLGLRFFDSLESLQYKSVVSPREFPSNEAAGVLYECLDNRVFEISWDFARRMRCLERFLEFTLNCEVAKLTTRSRGEFQCSAIN